MPIVYWIRTESINDTNDGYIGVTKYTKEFRLKQHIKTGRFVKYGSDDELISEVLFEGTIEECFKYEIKLRPIERMGWNIAPGGEGGYKGNNYVKQNGMSWRNKVNKSIKDNYASGKRQPWNKNKVGVQIAWNKGKSVTTKPYKEYKIKNILTNQIHTIYGQKEVAKLIGLSLSSVGKMLKGIPVKGCNFININISK